MAESNNDEDLFLIKLSDLFIEDYDIHTITSSNNQNKLLKDMLKIYGIKKRLLVKPVGTKYVVISGKRIVIQLNVLLKEGHIESNHLVPCLMN